jgi:V8-like Glu-specific endopeptidase
MKIIVVIVLISIIIQKYYAQTDTLINYNTVTGEITYYPSVNIDPSKTFDYTEWYYGNQPDISLLETSPPDSTYNNSGFTDLIPAQDIFPINDYPIRTAIKLFQIVDDTLRQRCSAIMVSKNLVLTSAHCIGWRDTTGEFVFHDSIYAYSAFDNGEESVIYGSSKVTDYILFGSFIKRLEPDIALLKLEKPLGNRTGWVGIAYNNDDDFFINSVFHKFSYPGTIDISDSTRIFNGDTLYYSYGTLDIVDDWLGYHISGIPGQSGSSLIYTDNEEYLSFGTLVWSANSRHLRITPEYFYPFATIINKSISYKDSEDKLIKEYYLSEAYPNPFNAVANIEYSLPSSGIVKLKVYDILGRKVATLINKFKQSGKYAIQFNACNLSSGVYLIAFEINNYRSTKKIVLLK